MSKAKTVTAPKRNGPATKEMREKRVPQLTEQELDFCREIQAGRKPGDAAVACGFAATKADALLKRPRVVEFLRAVQDQFVKEVAKQEAKIVIAKCPTKTELVNRLWEMANMRPLGIAESIAGQVAAAGKIATIMGFEAPKGNMEDDLQSYSEDELNQIALYGLDAEGKPARAPSIN